MENGKCSKCGEKDRADFQSVIEGFAPQRRNLIPILHALQGSMGYLTSEAMDAVARRLSIPASDVYGTATFYTLFATNPTGRHRLLLCDTPPCHMKGSKLIRKAVEKELGISPGETTPDESFSYGIVSCMGLCASAPAMMIDGDSYGNLTPEAIPGILAKYREEER
jgi:NADH:ubiquinone oxidoreductase subunit E